MNHRAGKNAIIENTTDLSRENDRMKRKFFFVLFSCFLFSTCAFSTFEFNERMQQAYLQIIRLKFDEGKRLLEKEQLLNPANQLPLLYDNYIDFLKAFISEEKKDLDDCVRNTDKRLKMLRDENSPFSLYSRAEIMLQDAILKVKFHEFVSAAWEIRKIYKITEQNTDRFPTFPLNRKISGLLKVVIGAIPKDYSWLTDLVGMEGTIIQGTLELTHLLKQTEGTNFRVYKDEILFYLSSIQSSFSKNDDTAIESTELMRPLCRESLLMRYSYSNVLMKAGRNDEALQLLADSALPKNSYPVYFLSYKFGLAKLRKLDFSAEKDFQNFIIHFHGRNNLRSAYQKLAWIYLLQGDQKKYTTGISWCKKYGYDFIDEDKDATVESVRGEIPNVILLRSRLLFDGGYYKQALSEIAGKSIDHFPRFKDQLEVTYRFARILQKLNEFDKAVQYYEETLKNGASSGYYFAANSALLLGIMYEEKNNFGKAKNYYTKCLSMRKHEYQNSIDQKAKAGLERVRAKK